MITSRRLLISVALLLLFVVFDRSITKDGNVIQAIMLWPVFLVLRIAHAAQLKNDYATLFVIIFGIPTLFLYWFGLMRALFGGSHDQEEDSRSASRG